MSLHKKDMIDNRALYHTLATVVLPIALQSLITSSLSLVDNLMVGSLGEAELAAVGLSSQLYVIHWSILFGICSGSSTFFAQFYGKKDYANIRKTIGFAIAMCLCIGIPFFFFALLFPRNMLMIFTNLPQALSMGQGYVRTAAVVFLFTSITVPFTTALRATQQTALPLKISITAFATNTFLNYVFIFGNFGAPKLGVTGAALATAIARGLELALTLYVVFGRRNLLSGRIRDFFGWPLHLMKRILYNTLPTTVNETMWVLGVSAYNAAYGRIGITAMASVQAGNTVSNLFIMAIFSLGDAMLILVGQRIGRGEMDYAYALSKRLLRIGVGVGVTSGLLLIVCSKAIVSLFDFTPQGAHSTVMILTVYGLFMAVTLFNGLNITGTLRAGGDTRFAMMAEVCTIWLVGVPLVFFGAMVLEAPVYVVVFLSQMEEVVKAVLCFIRYRSKKWLHNLVHDISPGEEGQPEI